MVEMTELTSALERIATWYWENEPQYNPIFLPGLSHEQIDRQLQDFQLTVPEEIGELYGWCNGSPHRREVFFRQYRLLPLEQVVRLRQDKYGLNQGESSIPDDPAWFPLFEFCGYLCILYCCFLETLKTVLFEPTIQNWRIIRCIIPVLQG